MVQKKTHIEIIAQVDLEPDAVLLNHFALVLVFHSNVLLSLSGAVSLPTSCAKVHPIFRDIEPLPNLKAYSLEVFTFRCWIAPVSGARECPDHGIPFGSWILGIQVRKPIDDEGKIWDVPLVQAKTSDALLGAPTAEMPHPIRESCCKQLWFNLSISVVRLVHALDCPTEYGFFDFQQLGFPVTEPVGLASPHRTVESSKRCRSADPNGATRS